MLLAAIVPPWQFPVIVSLGPWHVHIHQLCDILAYSVSFQVYLLCKRRMPNQPRLGFERQTWVLIGAIFGALAGAKLLAWAEQPGFDWHTAITWATWVQGKTIVGGLIGGWAGVECAKFCLGITSSTGDACVYPLIVGMAIGRVGCFLTGLSDNTYGLPTNLPWAVDFGDHVPRHPTQLYEILLLVLIGLGLATIRGKFKTLGVFFRVFVIAYMAMRFCIEFIKPRGAIFASLSPIQWTCLLAMLLSIASIYRLQHRHSSARAP